MRHLTWPILILLMLAGAVGAVRWRIESDHAAAQRFDDASASLAELQRQIRIHAATRDTDRNARGWPTTIDPAWFGAHPPMNPYVPAEHPWVEIASPHEAQLTDPAVRQALTREVAAYWYNPASGVIRARVGSSITDARALDVYNRLNASSIDTLYAAGVTIAPPPRRPAPRR